MKIVDQYVSEGIKHLLRLVVGKNVHGSTLHPLTPYNSIYRVFKENNHVSYLFLFLFVWTI